MGHDAGLEVRAAVLNPTMENSMTDFNHLHDTRKLTLPDHYHVLVKLHQVIRDAGNALIDGTNPYDANPVIPDLLGRLGLPIRPEPHLDPAGTVVEMVDMTAGVFRSIVMGNEDDQELLQSVAECLKKMIDAVNHQVMAERFPHIEESCPWCHGEIEEGKAA